MIDWNYCRQKSRSKCVAEHICATLLASPIRISDIDQPKKFAEASFVDVIRVAENRLLREHSFEHYQQIRDDSDGCYPRRCLFRAVTHLVNSAFIAKGSRSQWTQESWWQAARLFSTALRSGGRRSATARTVTRSKRRFRTKTKTNRILALTASSFRAIPSSATLRFSASASTLFLSRCGSSERQKQPAAIHAGLSQA